jgi:hypothetical protein
LREFEPCPLPADEREPGVPFLQAKLGLDEHGFAANHDHGHCVARVHHEHGGGWYMQITRRKGDPEAHDGARGGDFAAQSADGGVLERVIDAEAVGEARGEDGHVGTCVDEPRAGQLPSTELDYECDERRELGRPLPDVEFRIRKPVARKLLHAQYLPGGGTGMRTAFCSRPMAASLSQRASRSLSASMISRCQIATHCPP